MRRIAVILVGLLALPSIAMAQSEPYPNRPVRIIAPAGPGGNPDVIGRLLASKFSEALGRPFVVENMPGAGGVVAANMVAKANPDGYLYCFRGGLRSQIVQQWLKSEAGIDYPRVVGGYKAMRNFLLHTTEQAVQECDFVLVGGMTGTGKTEVLGQLDNAVDLEAHANHRGSSFGKRANGQPAQIDFENALSIDFLKRRASGHQQFVLEDEARLIGRCSLPLPLYQAMQHHPLVWLEDSVANRVERILQAYVVELCDEFVAALGAEEGFTAFAARLRESLGNITRRLGGERYQRLAAIMDQALQEQQVDGQVDTHRGWIEALLVDYYDPMYVFQRESKSGRIEFAGEQQAVVEYLRKRNGG